ncbi:Uncharacterized protein TPAR_06054 [Tolypocladium paradoxum]|uniref:SGNH hydrolase-type esterase domain-containing protein n=1 Tax=Tolypocladium paradoxum TaxID=94208 RepID=A0A2S4KUA1_9HYPO|nr:Uncharacterized protein TPAR_06054 [Tolypocladium paradoxum]
MIVWTSGLLLGLVPSGTALAYNQTLVASISRGAPLRVLPLGDSITYGYNEPSGNSYRRDVQCLLYVGGNPVSLIGSIKNGDWDNNDSDAFIYHTIDEIQEAGTPELTRQTSKPNVILLHAGTVNFVLSKNVTNTPERLGHLIDFITEHNPDTLLVVSQLIPNQNATVNALIDWYNDEMPAVVAARARAGKRVIMTSMRGMTVELLLDGTHPSERGSRVMAQRFYEAAVEAGRRGMVVAAEGPFTDRGASSLSPSGKCSDLKD